MRCHYSNNTAPASVQAGRDDTQNHIFTGEDTSNTWGNGDTTRSSRGSLHNTDRSRSAFFHELGDFLDSSLRSNGGGLRAGIHDRRQIWQGRLLSKGFDIREHSSRLWVCCQAASELRLHTGESTVQLLRGGRASFDFVEGFMEHLGDIKQANDVALLVTYRLLCATLN